MGALRVATAAASCSLGHRLRWLLPAGGTLSRTEWRQRHVVLLWLLWLHVIGLLGLSLWVGNGLAHSLLETTVLMPWGVLGSTQRLSRRLRSCAVSLGLLTASALLVHLADGAIEAHFHFFVVIAVIALYQDWLPFLVALMFVVLEHGVGGLVVPNAVYNHADAIANPWKWAAIHAAFVLAASAAQLAHWRLSELHQAQRLRTQKDLRENQRTLATLMSNLPGMVYRCANDADWTMDFASQGCLELTGYSQSDFTSRRVAYADIIHPADRERVWQETQAALARRQPYQFEYRITTAAGQERWVWEQGRAVLGEDGRLVALEGFIADVTERHQAQQALAYQALHDPLTDLPNRALLRQMLQAALADGTRDGAPLALLLLDLDGFRDVNDTFGHQHGDKLLQQVGQRLRDTLGTDGTLARLGGDEFGVLLPSAGRARACRLAQTLLEAVDAPFALEGQSVVLGASIGIALFPEPSADAEALLRHADVAMYQAKREGSGFTVYAADQDGYSTARLAMLGELRQAIESDQLVLHYQPIVDCGLGRVRHVEALVRWKHPERGLVPPDEFIPLAEQSGMIKPMTIQVLRMALRQCRAWQEQGIDLAVAVNLSMRNLHDPQLPWVIEGMLRDTGVSAERLKLEITESSIMADPARALDVLRRLRELGTLIAIDDFGTGYSSLAYLKRLPVDAIKIDKSFVRKLATDSSDRAIVRSAVELGHNLGLKVVAEGVEDAASLHELSRLRCDLVQGYYLGRPVPAAGLERWLDESAWGLARRALLRAA